MRHCVGGYGSRIKEGKDLIFHIKTKKGESTLELLLKNKDIKMGQHKAKFNKEPAEINKKIAQRLVKYLKFYNI